MKPTTPLVPIPLADLPTMLGRPIHLAWANPACVWILKKIEDDLIFVETPRTGKLLCAHTYDACYTRYWAERMENNG